MKTQTQAQFTPGPWAIAAHNCAMPGGTIASAITHGQTISGTRFIAFCEGEQREANARLVSAAPELLSALYDLLSLADNENLYEEWKAEFSAAEAALAKALNQ